MHIQDKLLCHGRQDCSQAASWIWLCTEKNKKNSYGLFRKRFHDAGAIKIHIAAETYYKVFLDGTLVDHGTTVSVPSYKTVDTYVRDVEAGEHVLAVMVHYLGEVCAVTKKSRPGLFVEIVTSDCRIICDRSWKAQICDAYKSDLPQMLSHFGFYEVFDFSKYNSDWASISFDDSSWAQAVIIDDAKNYWPRLIHRTIPYLQTRPVACARIIGKGKYQDTDSQPQATIADQMSVRKRTFTNCDIELPLELGTLQNEFIVVDWGLQVSGYIKIMVENSASIRTLDVGYDEVLGKNGVPDPRRTYAYYADQFIIPEGRHEITTFNPRSFRYLLLDCASAPSSLKLINVYVEERKYPVLNRNKFECSDPVLNRLYNTGIDTINLCMFDSYVDCPSRERVTWMDFVIQSITSAYTMNDTALWRQCLYLFAQDTYSRDDSLFGAVKAYVPSDNDPVIQSYVMYYVISLAQYAFYSGDIQTARNLFPVAMRQFEILRQFTGPSGMLNGDWPHDWKTFLDWSAMDFGGTSSASNAIYIRMLESLAYLAAINEKTDLNVQLTSKVAELRQAFKRYFWSEQEQLFWDALYDDKPSQVISQLSNAMAIWAGIVEPNQAHNILAKINDDSKLLPRTPGDFRLKAGFKSQTGGIVQIGTPAMAYFMVSSMFKHNMADTALKYIKDNWSGIEMNATFAEHFVTDSNTSFCHGWSGHISMSMFRHILGIKPTASGWKEVSICPADSELAWARASLCTPSGIIDVEWDKHSKYLALKTANQSVRKQFDVKNHNPVILQF